MAAAGLDGILVTTPVVAPTMIGRLVAARQHVADLAVVVDCEAGVDALAALASADRPIGVLVDIDMGQTRTGVTDIDAAVRVARRIADQPGLRYRGVQAYYGHLQHVPTLAERLEKLRERWARLAELPGRPAGRRPAGRDRLRRRHRHAPSRPRRRAVHRDPGGLLPVHGQAIRRRGAGPRRSALPHGAHDRDAGGQHGAAGPRDRRRRAQGDGDRRRAGPGRFRRTRRGHLSVHGRRAWRPALPRRALARPELGELVRLVAPHCDPTVNLHDRLHVVRGGRIVAIWPIEARGY